MMFTRTVEVELFRVVDDSQGSAYQSRRQGQAGSGGFRYACWMLDAGWKTDLRRPFVLVQNAGSMGGAEKASAVELALPHMRALADQMHLSAQLAVLDGGQCVCIQKVEAPGLIKIDSYVGQRMDLPRSKAVYIMRREVLQIRKSGCARGRRRGRAGRALRGDADLSRQRRVCRGVSPAKAVFHARRLFDCHVDPFFG